MPQIEIDFDVFKELTMRRATEDVTYNHVVRELLKMPAMTAAAKLGSPAKPWIVSNTSFPAGAEFLAEYKGKSYTATSKNGKLELSDGRVFTTPSAAAVAITGSNVNGWRFWKCKLPGASQYVLVERLRGKFH